MKQRARGLTLIELMVSLAIGSLLIIGAVTVYSQSRNTYRVSDTVARLQENARYALSIMEPDIQLAGNYGFSNVAGGFSFITNGNTDSGVPASGLTDKSDNVSVGGELEDCGANFVLNLVKTVQAKADYGLKCDPKASPDTPDAVIEKQPDADSLTIRRASQEKVTLTAGRVQIVSSRIQPAYGYILSDGVMPASLEQKTDQIEVRDVIVRTYYVSQHTENPARLNIPALRVKMLIPGPELVDSEVISGVEDFRVQLGVERGKDTDGDGAPDQFTGSAASYVDSDPAKVPAGYQVVAVRLWLLMRAEQEEQGFVDSTRFKYAGTTFAAKNDKYRRVLVSKTIQLRNSRNM